MDDKRLYRKILGILMESSFYFELSLRERHLLVMHLMRSSSISGEGIPVEEALMQGPFNPPSSA